MAKLQDLHDEIDAGKTAKLYLAKEHPDNPSDNKVTISIYRPIGKSMYYRKVEEENSKRWVVPQLDNWSILLLDKNSVDVRSNEWIIEG